MLVSHNGTSPEDAAVGVSHQLHPMPISMQFLPAALPSGCYARMPPKSLCVEKLFSKG
jgi:hypothetical protein